MNTLFTGVKNWAAAPFTTPMSLPKYAALIGLTMVLMILWTRVLSHIEAEL